MTRGQIVLGVLGLLTGGLGGSVLTWYINHPRPTVVTYNVVSTSTGADDTTKGLVPNLKLRIGDEDVSVIFTHTVDLVVQSGPQVESAVIALSFKNPLAGFNVVNVPDARLHVYGLSTQSPSPLHHMTCTPDGFTVHCDIGPLVVGTHAKFRFSVATNQPHTDEVFTVTNKVELVKVDDYLGNVKTTQRNWLQVASLFLSAVGGLIIGFLYWDKRVQERQTAKFQRILVERIGRISEQVTEARTKIVAEQIAQIIRKNREEESKTDPGVGVSG